jgi:hypothetical protein
VLEVWSEFVVDSAKKSTQTAHAARRARCSNLWGEFVGDRANKSTHPGPAAAHRRRARGAARPRTRPPCRF